MDPNQPQNNVPAAAPPEPQTNPLPPSASQTPAPPQDIAPPQFQSPSPQAPTPVTSPPQPQFQAAPPQADLTAQPSSSSGKSKVLIVVIVGALILIGLAAAAFFMLKGTGVGKSEPEKAITGFIDAVKSKDCAAFVEFYATSDLRGMNRSEFTQKCEEAKGTENDVFESIEGELPTIKTTELTKSSDTEATVKITGEVDGRDGSEELDLVFEDGKWRIDF